MNRVVKLLTLAVVLSLLAALAVVPAAAQDECCQGGIIVEGNPGGDVATMNPLLASDTASRRVAALISPGFLGTNDAEQVIAMNAPGAMVTTWDISEDGTVYTFHLRDDLVWSDGTPITSADVIYAWKAIQEGAKGTIDVQSSYIIDPTGQTGVLDVTAPDDYTVQIKFATAECTALGYAGSIYPIPAHVLPEDVTQLMDADYNMNPTVGWGPFKFAEFRPSEQVSLVGNPDYPDAQEGVVIPTGYIYKNVPDATVVVEQFLAGEISWMTDPNVSRRADIRATDAQVFDYPGNSWDYVAFNLADPENPQNAYDDSGNPIDQGHHPLFGDVRVRQALAKATDVDSIIQAAVFNEGARMTSFIIPSSWAYNNDLPTITYDPEAAAAQLEEAGWIDEDGDGIREAHGAMYAEDGTPLQFTLYTNEGNTRREAIGTLVQDEWAQIGVKVDFQTIDFNTLLDIMDSQTFDAFILGWRNGYPDDPDVTQILTSISDVVGSGSDFTSWHNDRFEELNDQAKNVPGCAPEDRAPLYHEMQQIFQEDVPYVPLFVINGEYAAGAGISGFDPYPNAPLWNVDSWSTLATP